MTIITFLSPGYVWQLLVRQTAKWGRQTDWEQFQIKYSLVYMTHGNNTNYIYFSGGQFKTRDKNKSRRKPSKLTSSCMNFDNLLNN